MAKTGERISIVVPVYNESAGIKEFYDKLLLPELSQLPISYEIIFVNDGSKDDSLAILQTLAAEDSTVRVINLSRNFGKEIALTAGITQSYGDAVLMLDADGQHPPARISDFISSWHKGNQVVIGIRAVSAHESAVKRWGSKLFYLLFNGLSGAKIVPRSTDFRLIDRLVRDEFVKCTERDRITRGLIDWLGFKRDYIEFESPARFAGTASYTTSGLVKLALNSFTSLLSLKPLFIFGWAGLFISLAALIFGLFIIIEQFLLGDPLSIHFSGAFMLGVFMALLVGIVLMSQAMIAILFSRIYTQSQGRPLYVIDKKESIRVA